MFIEQYGGVRAGTEAWQQIDGVEGELYPWDEYSTYIQEPPYFDGFTLEPKPILPIVNARVLGLFGDSITTDHISPAGDIALNSPAGQWLEDHDVAKDDFNQYGARRGNDKIMTRGTFANIRLKNLLVPGVEGGVTTYQPAGEQMFIYDAAMKYKAAGTPLVVAGRQGIRHRLFARLGGQGQHVARRARCDRRELRAHPPQQPGGHGRAPASVPRRAELGDTWLEGR